MQECHLSSGYSSQSFAGIFYPLCSITVTFSGLDSAISQFPLPIRRRKVVGTIYCGLVDATPEPGSEHNILIAKTKIQPTFECVSSMGVEWCCPRRQEEMEVTVAELQVVLGYITSTRCTQDEAWQKNLPEHIAMFWLSTEQNTVLVGYRRQFVRGIKILWSTTSHAICVN